LEATLANDRFNRTHLMSTSVLTAVRAWFPLQLLWFVGAVCCPWDLVTAQPQSPTFGLSNDDFYDPKRVLKVEIRIAPEDWNNLRRQQRDGLEQFSRERYERSLTDPYKPYTWFKADVVVDGVTVTSVGVRKRGFFGSEDKDRPGLNIDFDQYVAGQEFAGDHRLTLSNNKEDPSLVRQLLAYRVFGAAGVPTIRCNFAHVWLNGTDLGVYTHLETVDKRYLARNFEHADGSLYECAVSDFLPGWGNSFQGKRKNSDRSDLEKVTRALQTGDLSQISEVVDVDAFTTFWATETLIGHWDGYAGIGNNSFVYFDPGTGRLRFIPWGTDTSLRPVTDSSMLPFDPPVGVMAVGEISRRLYDLPATREQYRQRLRDLLDSAWNENDLLAEMDRVEALLREHLPESQLSAEEWEKSLAETRSFIRTRRAVLKQVLGAPAVRWNHPRRVTPYNTAVGSVSASFSAVWTARPTVSPFEVSRGASSGGMTAVQLEFYRRSYSTREAECLLAQTDVADAMSLAIRAEMPEVQIPIFLIVTVAKTGLKEGVPIRLSPQGNNFLYAGEFEDGTLRFLGEFPDGTVTFDEIPEKEGDLVKGRITSEVGSFAWEKFDLRALRGAGQQAGR